MIATANDGLSARDTTTGARIQAWQAPDGWRVGRWSTGAARASDAYTTARSLSHAREQVTAWTKTRATCSHDEGAEMDAVNAWEAISEALDRNAAGELSAADVCAVGFSLQERMKLLGTAEEDSTHA